MRPIDAIRLVTLGAIWGTSFLFMRILSPAIGPLATANFRILFAGIVLSIYFFVVGFNPELKKYWKDYLGVGVVNSAIPFALFAYGALYLPASYESILNATAPLFGALFSWAWLKEEMTLRKFSGLLIATSGVGFVVHLGAVNMSSNFVVAVIACLGAGFCYGFGGAYIKKYASHIKPMGFAGCSQLLAGLLFVPFTATQHIPGPITAQIILCALGLSLLCSGIAYILYYQLIADLGPTSALTVTFLIPVFGMLWGHLFLHETITPSMLLGVVLIILGTWFVLRKKTHGTSR